MLCKGFGNLSIEFNGNEIKSALENPGVFRNLQNGRGITDLGPKFTVFSSAKRDQQKQKGTGKWRPQK